jgi:hypothetical protein
VEIVSEKLPALVKWRGCPMTHSKLRKSAKCMGCRKELRPKEVAFRSMLDGAVGGVQRFERVCIGCIKALGTDPRYCD